MPQFSSDLTAALLNGPCHSKAWGFSNAFCGGEKKHIRTARVKIYDHPLIPAAQKLFLYPSASFVPAGHVKELVTISLSDPVCPESHGSWAFPQSLHCSSHQC